MTAPPRQGPIPWGYLLGSAALWGSSFFFNRIAIAELPGLTITAARLILATATLLPIALAMSRRFPVRPADWAPFFVLTLMSNIGPYLLVLEAQKETASGLAAVLIATTPLFTILLAHVFTSDEKMRLNKLAGVLAGIAGVAIVVGPDVLTGWSGALAAKAALVLAALLYAMGGIYTKRLAHLDPLVLATMQMAAAALVAIPLALLLDRPWTLPPPSATVIGSLVWIGVLGSALAGLCYFQVFVQAGATNAMLITLLVPVTPILLGAAFLGERLLAREFVGALVIALALLFIDGRLTGRRRR